MLRCAVSFRIASSQSSACSGLAPRPSNLPTKRLPGKVANELLYRHDEPRLDLVEQGRPWSFDGDGTLFRLVSEAHRIRLAHLFDPVLAVHTSIVDPLPHQITAVYEAMLTRNEILYSLNKPEDFILAIVEFIDGDSYRVHYLRQPFQRDPDFGVTSVNYDCAELLARAKEPS